MTSPAPAVASLVALCPCPRCGVRAIVELTPAQRLAQPDDTTHVCHPLLGGCNHGFTDDRTRDTPLSFAEWSTHHDGGPLMYQVYVTAFYEARFGARP